LKKAWYESMNVQKWIAELRQQLDETDRAIAALERLAQSTGVGGRSPAPPAKAKKPASPKRAKSTKASERSQVGPQSRVEPNVAQAVVEMAIEQPRYSYRRVSRELRKRGLDVSPAVVCNVWLEQELQTYAKRLRRIAVETRLSQEPSRVLTEVETDDSDRQA
jgi:hypothetical protein